jgi:hypothetical protein
METCTITQNLEIVKGTRRDYESLSQYHYRECHLGPYAAIYALKGPEKSERFPGLSPRNPFGIPEGKFRTATKLETVGVIVYAMPTAGAQMRNVATGGVFAGLGKGTGLSLINKNIRTISRVIIEPRFRSLGLAARLVRETMPLMNVPFVEALAVMGQVNPFFEKAGMTRFDPPVSTGCVRLIEALGAVGIEQQDLIDPQLVQRKLDAFSSDRLDFIEVEITRFLQCYGRRRLMPAGIERTKFVLSKLTDRPVYYLWQNPNIELRI